MEFFGYLFSVAIGVSLGLIGGGGSILTIPVLVYFFEVEPVVAGGYSLFVVGASSLIGVAPKFRQQLVDLRTALIFGLPSLLAVVLSRRYILPSVPEVLFTVSGYAVSRSDVMMVLFALLMIVAARAMLKDADALKFVAAPTSPDIAALVLQGLAVGVVTGLLGAGGGFLIIPALVMLSKLPMKTAVGTSLLIITVNSFVGFFGDWSGTGATMNWTLLLTITALAIAGIFIGNFFGRKINGLKLKRGFAVFVLVLGAAILLSEIMTVLGLRLVAGGS